MAIESVVFISAGPQDEMMNRRNEKYTNWARVVTVSL